MKDRKDVHVIRLAKIPLVNHRPVDIYRNPYIDRSYFNSLRHEREINNVAGKYRAVWTRQEGCCFYCGAPMLPDQDKAIAAIDVTVEAAGRNMAYIHAHCEDTEINFIKTTVCQYPSDVKHLLAKLASGEMYMPGRYKFETLKEYLYKQTRPTVTISFKQVEKILGFPLPKASRKEAWWFRKWGGGISEAGYSAGYCPSRVDLVKRKVTFKRDEQAASSLIIPESFTHGKIPVDAASELMSFFQYIRDKYGI